MNYLDKKEEAKIKVESIAYNSPEFQQAARLRYDLFFAEHNFPWSVTQDSNQGKYLHAAILHENTVLAYGQLVPKKKGISNLPDGSQTRIPRSEFGETDTFVFNRTGKKRSGFFFNSQREINGSRILSKARISDLWQLFSFKHNGSYAYCYE